MTNNNPDTISDREVRRIVRGHKVFWTTIPLELSEGKGEIMRVGMSLVLVGTDADEKSILKEKDGPSIFDKLNKIAEWLMPEDAPNVRFEVRRNVHAVFYQPDDLRTNRKNYALGIRILHRGKFDEPMDDYQKDVLNEFQKKLKEIGCPKDHWKENA